MTKEITKSNILQEITDKFALREFESARFLFDETVVPVYEIGKQLLRPYTDYEEVSITSGPLGFTFFTVPENERWLLGRYNIVFMGAGAYTVTGAYIIRKVRATGATIYLDMLLGQTVSYAVELHNPVRLDPGDRILVYVDSWTSTQALRLYIDFVKEEIR